MNYGKKNEYLINSDSLIVKNKDFLGHFLHGFKLKSYEFKKYKTKKENRIISLSVYGKYKVSNENQLKFKALEEGTFFKRPSF